MATKLRPKVKAKPGFHKHTFRPVHLGARDRIGDDSVAVDRKTYAKIRQALDFPAEHGPVRMVPERVGEVANLPDPWENSRSKAAILAKKHQEKSQKLRNIYNASQKRELNQEEVASVFAIWEGIRNGAGGHFENELAGGGGELGGALGPSRDGPQCEDPQEGGGDGGDDEDLASGMAGPEEDEGDPCL